MSKFKIGQRVICYFNESDLSEEMIKQWNRVFNDHENERLVLNETYEIDDIDIHFPRKICVKLKGPYYFHSEFVPEEFFTDDKSVIRNEKIESILNL